MSKRSRNARRLVLRTSAKVNLALEVLGKRPDGYHEIVTVMQAVDLWDRLILEEAPTLAFATDAPGLPTDEQNLVVRAAKLLQEAAAVRGGAAIRLRKGIPVAAGLGGGSSDAAATLVGLNRLWGLRWSRQRLRDLAVRIGMDVPFFLGRGRALASGRGEEIEELPAGGGYALVLVNPGLPLSTREVYGRIPPGWHAGAVAAARMIEALRSRSPARVAAVLANSLEAVVEPTVPVIGRMKQALLAAGALGAAMSGSGPTVFGVATSLDQAQRIRRRVNRAGWSCWAVRTQCGPCVRVAKA